jgi:hypothetical protein
MIPCNVILTNLFRQTNTAGVPADVCAKSILGYGTQGCSGCCCCTAVLTSPKHRKRCTYRKYLYIVKEIRQMKSMTDTEK